MKYLYKYPQKRYPYEELVSKASKQTRDEPEYELYDTGIFEDNRYFDIFVEMAKDTENEEELLFRITAYNRGPEPAPLHIVPQMWFRNTWSWGIESEKKNPIPELSASEDDNVINFSHWRLGDRYVHLGPSASFSICQRCFP